VLKGFLIYFGVEPEFTYNIEVLINELKKNIDVPTYVNGTAELTNYAVLTRYPGEYQEITKEMYEKAVKMAQECIIWVENTIKEIEKAKKPS
jgi:HEPN domain-containing protein